MIVYFSRLIVSGSDGNMDAYHDMSRKPEDWTEAELVDEYEAWKVANPNV